MATKKKKPVKTMDVVAPKKKAKKVPTIESIDIEVNETPADTTIITADTGSIEITATKVEDDATLSAALNEAFPEDEDDIFKEEITVEEKPMQKKPEPEVETKAEIKKSAKKADAPKAKKSFFRSPLKIISSLIVLASAVSVGILIFNISRSNLLPAKFFYPIVGILAAVVLLFLRFTLRNKTKTITHVILDIFSIVFLAVSLFGNIKLGDTISFLDQNLNGVSYQTITYNIITGKDSKYTTASSLNGTTITTPPDFVLSEDELITEVKNQLSANLVFDENIDTVTNLPITDSDALIMLGKSIYDSIVESSSTYSTDTKVIASLEIKKRIEKTDDNEDLASKPFLIFLSGIDTREAGMPYTSLSDVNMAIAVNPKTAQILLVTVPRDYYVQIPGTTGLKDKLTHAGALGGVKLSEDTVANLLDVTFNDYVRVNFNFLVGLVDAIGGIEIYSDSSNTFTAWTDSSCSFVYGNNFVDGRCALAFARERRNYETGDTHRAANQQQVFEKVFQKLSSSSTLISKYSEILDSLNGTFETSLTSSDISSLVRYQLDNFPSWKIHSYTLSGTAGDDYTYSYPSQLHYVTYPDTSSIAKAKEILAEVLNGN